MGIKSKDILVVGSVPLESVEDVLEACAGRLGDRVFALPDGEIGPRLAWINALPHMSYNKNTDLEPVRTVNPENVQSPEDHGQKQMAETYGTFKLKPGVTDTRFDLHFGHEAIKSYETFRRLRDRGSIGKDVRFQVGLPFTSDGVDLFFSEPSDYPIVTKAYARSIQDAIALILKHVPGEDLVIQWDYCTEVLHCLGALDELAPVKPTASLEDRFQWFTSKEYVGPLSETIPDEVLVGYHLCFGTWGGWPVSRVLDIDLIVRLANGLVANTPHRVDYVHLPGMPNPSDEFFAPLADLDIGDTKVFLGIELADGVDALEQRAGKARRHLSEFGIAHYCGYGREDSTRVLELLDDLRAGAQRSVGTTTS